MLSACGQFPAPTHHHRVSVVGNISPLQTEGERSDILELFRHPLLSRMSRNTRLIVQDVVNENGKPPTKGIIALFMSTQLLTIADRQEKGTSR